MNSCEPAHPSLLGPRSNLASFLPHAVTDFCLSPGVTPFLTSLVVVEFALVTGLAYTVAGGRGFEVAVAGNAMVLGLFKLVSDYRDLGDLPISFAALGGGLAATLLAARRVRLSDARRTILRAGGLLVALVGWVKIALDFCDPFDLLLGATAVVAGILVWTYGQASRVPAPPPAASP